MTIQQQQKQLRDKIKKMPAYLHYWAQRLVSLKQASDINLDNPHIVTGATEQRYIDRIGLILGINTHITQSLDTDNSNTSRRYGVHVFRVYKLAGERIMQGGLGKPKLARKIRKQAIRFNNPLIKTHNIVIKEVNTLPEGFTGSITFNKGKFNL